MRQIAALFGHPDNAEQVIRDQASRPRLSPTGSSEHELPYYHLRHLVRPGLTGWAQVNYPYGANLEDTRMKLEYDLYYIKFYSLYLDLVIVLRTVRVCLFGVGGR